MVVPAVSLRRPLRRALMALLPALLVGCALLMVAEQVEAATVRIATLAPKRSLWGKVFNTWSKALDKKTNGAIVLHFYWNGAQGDEDAVVAKIRSGQLDGGTLGARGLGTIHRPVLALQLPGLFESWQSIDRAREMVYPEFRDAFDKQGFVLSSIGDVGRARTLSKGRAVRLPEDLKTMKPFAPRQGVVAPALASVLQISPVRLSLPELLPALSAGRVNVVVAPAYAAEQLQWTPFLDHVGEDVVGIAVGAMVLSKRSLEPLPADALEVMRKTGVKAGAMLRKRVRKQDDAAYKRLHSRMKPVKLSASERAKWAAVFAQVRKRLAQGELPPALIKRMEGVAGR